jgi:hypothetical protein
MKKLWAYGCYNNQCLLSRLLTEIDFVIETTHWVMGLQSWLDNFIISTRSGCASLGEV